MPTTLLFPLLVIALVLNAALVAVAVRQLATERRREGVRHMAHGTRGPGAPAASAPAQLPGVTGGETPRADAAPEGGGEPGAGAAPAPGSPVAPEAPVALEAPPARAVPPAPTPTADADPPAAPPTPSSATATRNRRTSRTRRFTLPPLGEDRERADRAIELFLSGGRSDLPIHPHPAPAARAATADRRAAPGPDGRTASVAIVAIAGFRTLASIAGTARARAIVDAVEETLRRSARADDHVVGLEDGRFRILLVGSSERAANVYLDRVRTACAPWLAAAGTPLDLVTASAQAGPDGDLGRALRTAERRLVRAAGGADVPRDERA